MYCSTQERNFVLSCIAAGLNFALNSAVTKTWKFLDAKFSQSLFDLQEQELP
jgi:hypothetical protein